MGFSARQGAGRGVAAGSPPVEEWRGTAPTKAPVPKAKPDKGDVVLRAYTRDQAAEALGMSVDSFDKHVMGEIKSMQFGRLVRIPLAELDRYAEKKARRAL